MSSTDAADYTRAVLDIAIRVTEVLFTNGAGAEDAVAAMQAVTHAYGLRNIEADITHTLISLSWENPSTYETISRSRNVKYRTLDYHKLTRATELIGRIIDDPPSVPDARRQVAAIVSGAPAYPRGLRRIGWALVGTGAAFLLGGGLIVAAASFLATLVIDLITSALQRRRVPVFYQSMVGGAIGPLVAAVVYTIDPGVNPSLVVVATIIMLLAGVTTFGAVHDTLSGFYVTGTARLVEAVLITSGLVAGVLGTTLLLARFGIVLQIDATMAPSIDGLPMQLVPPSSSSSASPSPCRSRCARSGRSACSAPPPSCSTRSSSGPRSASCSPRPAPPWSSASSPPSPCSSCVFHPWWWWSRRSCRWCPASSCSRACCRWLMPTSTACSRCSPRRQSPQPSPPAPSSASTWCRRPSAPPASFSVASSDRSWRCRSSSAARRCTSTPTASERCLGTLVVGPLGAWLSR